MRTLSIIFVAIFLVPLVWTAKEARQPSCNSPYVASLIAGEKVQKFLCTATIISEKKLVTAAHCVANKVAINLSARVGTCSRSSKGHVRSVLYYLIPDNFKCDAKPPRDSDLAIVVLAKALTFDGSVSPIPLASQELRNRYFDKKVVVVGWGHTATGLKPDLLGKSGATLLARGQCKRKMPNQGITEKMICAFSEDQNKRIQCQGDVGGPLVIREGNKDFLVGVATSAAGFLESKQCHNLPTVYADVAQFAPWLNSKGTLPNKLQSRGIKYGSKRYCNVKM